jgi:LPXTG-motif cell wall-anchored protein
MRKRISTYLIAFFVGVLLVGSVLPAGGAEKELNLGSFVGAAGSHAVKISIGDLVLTVGGGESRAGYARVRRSPIQILDKIAKADARGIVIPGVVNTSVSCSPPKLSDEITALETPEALEPLLSAKVGLASCALGLGSLPTADHAAGEVLAEVRLTETVVDSVPQVNEFLDTLRGALAPLPESTRGQVSSVIGAIQAQLASQPLLRISVAPNHGTVTSTTPGISSVAPGTAVTIDVLGGVLKIDIAVAEAAASIVDGKPAAAADVAFVHVKALNILTPDPDDALIDQRITAPQDLSILDGTPLATSIATERGVTDTSCAGDLARFDACAKATADAVALSLLASPLPNIGVELVHTEVLAAGNLDDPAVKRTDPVLPKTGAGVASAMIAGLSLAFGGLGLRRRLTR